MNRLTIVQLSCNNL